MKKTRIKWTSGNRNSSNAVPVVLILGLAAFFLQLTWVRQNREKFVETSMKYQFQSILPSQIRRIQCGMCSGTGLAEFPPGSGQIGRCPQCLGVGFREVRLLDRMEALCARCGGMGRCVEAQTGHVVPCAACDSRGLVILPDNRLRGAERYLLEIDCPVCDGLGTIREAESALGYRLCPVCFGLGKNRLRKLSDNDQLCNVCQGMGRVYDATNGTASVCSRCGGAGLFEATGTPADQEE